jgi:hypothetical protein
MNASCSHLDTIELSELVLSELSPNSRPGIRFVLTAQPGSGLVRYSGNTRSMVYCVRPSLCSVSEKTPVAPA